MGFLKFVTESRGDGGRTLSVQESIKPEPRIFSAFGTTDVAPFFKDKRIGICNALFPVSPT
jgi:hypothetical protein